MKRIIISGAGGFLGTELIRRALNENLNVIAISSGDRIQAGIPCINTEEFLKNGWQCTSEDIFINCLFPTNADGLKMADGLNKVYQMIDRAYESGAGSFINISSQSVYASKRTAPATEESQLSLETPYAVGKYSSEAMVNRIFADRPHTNIRLASLIGVGYDQRILNRMIIQAMKGETLKVVGGMQRYGFLDVRDAAAGLIKLAESNPEKWRETYNLGRNDSCTLTDIAECVVSEMKLLQGRDVLFTVVEGRDDRNSSIDASVFMKSFNWSPEITLSGTAKEIILSKMSQENK